MTCEPGYPCVNHPDREAFVFLDNDGRLLCRECYLDERTESKHEPKTVGDTT